MKSVRIQGFSGSYFPVFGLGAGRYFARAENIPRGWNESGVGVGRRGRDLWYLVLLNFWLLLPESHLWGGLVLGCAPT